MVDRTQESSGEIDILVNNAGMAAPPGMPFTNNTEEDWDRTFAVNTKSVFLTSKAIAPYFIERKAGRIINIASIAGPLAALTMPPYSVAKEGVITFTRVVAKELARARHHRQRDLPRASCGPRSGRSSPRTSRTRTPRSRA